MVIAIIVVYILSIVAVNFFGLQIKQFEGKIYVNRIDYELRLIREENADDPEADDITDIADTEETTKIYKTFKYVPGDYTKDNLSENPNAVFIQPRCYPDDADNKRVKYEYDATGEEKGRFYFDKATGTVYFFRGNRALTIRIVAADGSGVSTTLTIFAMGA